MSLSFAHDSRDLAETYDRTSDLQLESGQHLVERMGLAAGACVLDVGCGTGRLTQWIASRVGSTGSVIGIDPLAERIGVARERGGPVRFEVGQAEELGAFGDASFDAVCMSSVLHWVTDKTRALAEAHRVLRPGGRLGVTMSPHELARAGTIPRVLERLLESPPYVGHVDTRALSFGGRGATSTDLVNLVLASGLELSELHVAPHVSHHESGSALVDFIEASSFGSILGIVPESLRASLRADLIAAFDAERGPSAGSVVVRGFSARLVAARA